MTLAQFQEIKKIQSSDISDEEKMTEMVAALSGKTVNQVEEMPVLEFQKLSAEIVQELQKPLPKPSPKKVLGGVGILYEPGKLSRGQYVTVQHFLKGDSIINAHLILASISYNLKTNKHEAEKHQEIAERIQNENISDVVGSVVFFCQVFESSIRGLSIYLVKETKKMNNPVAMMGLIRTLDGYTTPNGLPTLRG